MARDSAVGHERILVVPGSLALDNSASNQHVTSVQNDLNQQILEVSQTHFPILISNTIYMNRHRTSRRQFLFVVNHQIHLYFTSK